MKPKGLAKTLLGTSVLTASIIVSFVAPRASAASDTWDNGASDNLWQTVTNWVSDTGFPGTASAVYTSTDDASFSTTGATGTIDLGGTINIRSLLFGVSGGNAASFAIGDANDTLNFTTAGGITINSGVTTAQTIGAAGTTINLSNAAAASTTFTNNGTGLLTIAGNIAANVASGNGVLNVNGTGNTTISGTITKPGAGSNALFKSGSGTLTLSNGSVWSGAGAVQTAFSGPMTVQEGTLLLNGGTHAVTGEAVIGGVVTHGGAGQNAKVQVDSGALNISGFLSIGRGNGTGTATSELVLNNAATVTAASFSSGFNAGNVLNLPKGSITLNGTSTLTIATNGQFTHAESAGSNMSLTLNNSSAVAINGAGNATNRVIGGAGATGSVTLNDTSSFTSGNSILNVGYQTGNGTITVNGGTFNHAGELRVSATNINSNAIGTGTINISGGSSSVSLLTLARGNDNTFQGTGTLNVSGGSFTSINDALIGWNGSANASANVNVTGGTFNVGTTAEKWMQIGINNGVKGQVVVSGGNLNLNTNSDIRFSTNASSAGANVLTLSGGAITGYTGNQTGALGDSVIDLMNAAATNANNTFNLNGGVATVRGVVSTTNSGTRTLNLNGGTLKATGATANFITLGTGNARANVRNGGAIIDTNGFNVTVAQALEHSNIGGDNATDGGLVKKGSGILTLNGANTYTGATKIENGSIALGASGTISSSLVLGTAASSTVGSLDATAKSSLSLTNLSGSGTVNIGAGKTVTVTGTFGPGFSPGKVAVTGDLTLDASSSTIMEIGGTTRAVDSSSLVAYDAVDVSGALAYGGTLAIVDFNGFNLSDASNFSETPTIFDLFAAGTFGGDYAAGSVSVDGLVLTGGEASGDWTGLQDTLSYTFSQSTGDLTVTVVPEPATALLGGLGLLALLRRRRVA